MITAALITIRCCKCRTSNDGNANETSPADNHEYAIARPREVYIINNNIYTVNINQ